MTTECFLTHGSNETRTMLIDIMLGRRYHRYAEGKYALPNDEKEQDRLDLAHHHALLLMKGNLYFAPISDKPQRILDCGTGTGIWVLDMADSFPSAQVTGVDLSPIQPKWSVTGGRFKVYITDAD